MYVIASMVEDQDGGEDALLALSWDHIQIVWITFPDQIPLDWFRRLNDPLGRQEQLFAVCIGPWPSAHWVEHSPRVLFDGV